jgi:hypothetical protein
MRMFAVTRFDGPRYALVAFPFGASNPVWFTGSGVQSAGLRPKIRYFRTEKAAALAISEADLLLGKAMSAQYAKGVQS